MLFAMLAFAMLARTPVFAGDTTQSVSYTVSIPDPAAQSFQVKAQFTGFRPDTLYFPVWAPGAYDIVNFGKYVSVVSGQNSAGNPLVIQRADDNTVILKDTASAPSTGFTVSYTVKDIENVPNSMWMGLSDIEKSYAFANGTALYGYMAGYKDAPCTVSFSYPQDWDIAIGLDSTAPNTYRAANYDQLADAPLQLGKFQRWDVMIGGKRHIITVSAPRKLTDGESRALVEKTTAVVKAASAVFGEMPYDRYVFQHFLVTYTDENFGGKYGALEHSNSSTYVMPWPYQMGVELMGGKKGGHSETDIAAMLAPVIAHEYWHLWSPKRIHVRELGPFNYQRGPRTSSLWFAEGVTEYYARVLLARNALRSQESFLKEMDQEMQEFLDRPQNQSMTELSMGITDVKSMAEIIPLYTKGPLIGLLLDAEIRSQTNNAKSLDDAMRYFNANYAKTGKSFGDDDIIPIIQQATGANLMDFYKRYIAGHEALPFAAQLPKVGLAVETLVDIRKDLGAEYTRTAEGLRITKVVRAGSAEKMKLKVDDVITTVTTSINGQNMTLPLAQIPDAAINQMMPQLDDVTLVVKRKNRDMVVKGKIVDSSVRIRQLALDPNATPETTAIRRSMLGF